MKITGCQAILSVTAEYCRCLSRGPYVIVSHYGQYAVDGLRNVKLDNKGIDIKGKPGAKARAIFDGEVSAIFQYNGLNNIFGAPW